MKPCDHNYRRDRWNASHHVGSIEHLSSRDRVDVTFELKDAEHVITYIIFNNILSTVRVDNPDIYCILYTAESGFTDRKFERFPLGNRTCQWYTSSFDRV